MSEGEYPLLETDPLEEAPTKTLHPTVELFIKHADATIVWKKEKMWHWKRTMFIVFMNTCGWIVSLLISGFGKSSWINPSLILFSTLIGVTSIVILITQLSPPNFVNKTKIDCLIEDLTIASNWAYLHGYQKPRDFESELRVVTDVA